MQFRSTNPGYVPFYGVLDDDAADFDAPLRECNAAATHQLQLETARASAIALPTPCTVRETHVTTTITTASTAQVGKHLQLAGGLLGLLNFAPKQDNLKNHARPGSDLELDGEPDSGCPGHAALYSNQTQPSNDPPGEAFRALTPDNGSSQDETEPSTPPHTTEPGAPQDTFLLKFRAAHAKLIPACLSSDGHPLTARQPQQSMRISQDAQRDAMLSMFGRNQEVETGEATILGLQPGKVEVTSSPHYIPPLETLLPLHAVSLADVCSGRPVRKSPSYVRKSPSYKSTPSPWNSRQAFDEHNDSLTATLSLLLYNPEAPCFRPMSRRVKSTGRSTDADHIRDQEEHLRQVQKHWERLGCASRPAPSNLTNVAASQQQIEERLWQDKQQQRAQAQARAVALQRQCAPASPAAAPHPMLARSWRAMDGPSSEAPGAEERALITRQLDNMPHQHDIWSLEALKKKHQLEKEQLLEKLQILEKQQLEEKQQLLKKHQQQQQQKLQQEQHQRPPHPWRQARAQQQQHQLHELNGSTSGTEGEMAVQQHQERPASEVQEYNWQKEWRAYMRSSW